MALKKRGVLDALQPAKNVPPKAPEPEPAAEARSKTLTLRLSVPAWTAIKMLAFERGLTAQAVVLEGLNAVLVKNGKPPVV